MSGEIDERQRACERWLATWIARHRSGQSFDLTPASSDASFRRYFRATLADGATLIVMDAPPKHEDCRPFVDVARRLEIAGVNVPQIIAADYETGFLLLQDLGALCYLDALDDDRADRLYGDAIDTLVRMQRNAPMDGLPPYDKSALLREMNLFPEWFLGVHTGCTLSVAAQEVLRKAFDWLSESCLLQPQALVHRDYHSRNLMVCASANPGVLDFQDAVVGPVAYDLVSLLRDVYISWPDHQVEQWRERYVDAACDAGVLRSVHRDAMAEWVDWTGVQRHIKIAGIFCRLYHRDGKPGYLQDIPLTLKYLCDVAKRYPALDDFSDLLSSLDLESRLALANSTVMANPG